MADVIKKAIASNPVRVGVAVVLATFFPKFAKRTSQRYPGVNDVARDGETDLAAVEAKYTIRYDDRNYY